MNQGFSCRWRAAGAVEDQIQLPALHSRGDCCEAACVLPVDLQHSSGGLLLQESGCIEDRCPFCVFVQPLEIFLEYCILRAFHPSRLYLTVDILQRTHSAFSFPCFSIHQLNRHQDLSTSIYPIVIVNDLNNSDSYIEEHRIKRGYDHNESQPP